MENVENVENVEEVKKVNKKPKTFNQIRRQRIHSKISNRKRYANDPEFRERQIAKCKERITKLKKEKYIAEHGSLEGFENIKRGRPRKPIDESIPVRPRGRPRKIIITEVGEKYLNMMNDKFPELLDLEELNEIDEKIF